MNIEQIRKNINNVSHPHRVVAMCIPVVILLLMVIAACVAGYFLTK